MIPIIADDYVVIPKADSTDAKEKYASGFLKVTPAHDPNDYEIGQRHEQEIKAAGLPVMINVMAPDASISKDHGWPAAEWPPRRRRARFSGRAVRRHPRGSIPSSWHGPLRHRAPRPIPRRRPPIAIIQWFKDHDLLEETRPYRHAVGHSYRSHVPVEPYLSDQWYVAVKKPTKRLGNDDSPVEGTDVPKNSPSPAPRCVHWNTHPKPRMRMRGYASPAFPCGATKPPYLHPRTLRKDLPQLARKHPRLVHLPPTLVGASDSGVVLRVGR